MDVETTIFSGTKSSPWFLRPYPFPGGRQPQWRPDVMNVIRCFDRDRFCLQPLLGFAFLFIYLFRAAGQSLDFEVQLMSQLVKVGKLLGGDPGLNVLLLPDGDLRQINYVGMKWPRSF